MTFLATGSHLVSRFQTNGLNFKKLTLQIELDALTIGVTDERCFLSPSNLPRLDFDDDVAQFFPPKVKANVPRIVHMHRGRQHRGRISPGEKGGKKSPVKTVDKNTLANVSTLSYDHPM